jgi:hypothetical protein
MPSEFSIRMRTTACFSLQKVGIAGDDMVRLISRGIEKYAAREWRAD